METIIKIKFSEDEENRNPIAVKVRVDTSTKNVFITAHTDTDMTVGQHLVYGMETDEFDRFIDDLGELVNLGDCHIGRYVRMCECWAYEIPASNTVLETIVENRIVLGLSEQHIDGI